MNIDLNLTSEVKDLKKQFHQFFPLLKLEVFSGNSHNKVSVLDNGFKLKDAGLKESVNINFDGSKKVSEFENMMLNLCGLQVQVFRKSGSVYLETHGTDDWTLNQAQKESMDSEANSASNDFIDVTDRDQWE